MSGFDFTCNSSVYHFVYHERGISGNWRDEGHRYCKPENTRTVCSKIFCDFSGRRRAWTAFKHSVCQTDAGKSVTKYDDGNRRESALECFMRCGSCGCRCIVWLFVYKENQGIFTNGCDTRRREWRAIRKKKCTDVSSVRAACGVISGSE